MQRDLAGVGLVLPGEDAQQRRLAGPVGADEPDPLAGVELERHVLEQRRGVVPAGHVGAGEQQHQELRNDGGGGLAADQREREPGTLRRGILFARNHDNPTNVIVGEQ